MEPKSASSLLDHFVKQRVDAQNAVDANSSAYPIRNPKLFPDGRLKLVMSPNQIYMGQDKGVYESEGFPVLAVHATVHLEKPDGQDEEIGQEKHGQNSQIE